MFFEKTKDGEIIYDVSSRLAKDRVLYLDCEIDQEVASVISSMMFLLDREAEDKPISLWINSPGGEVQGFFAIYDMMHRIKAPIRTICMGEAMSASAILLAAGTPGMRHVMPHARVMIHQIRIDGMGGTGTEVEIGSKEIKKLKIDLTEILARHTGQSIAKIKKDTIHDKYMGAAEAVKYGLADKILEPKKQIPELKKRKSSGNSILPPNDTTTSEEESSDEE
jgi:ATP-dependent Clp protease protease subunit